MSNNWERDEWWLACDDTPVRRFAGGIEIVGDADDVYSVSKHHAEPQDMGGDHGDPP